MKRLTISGHKPSTWLLLALLTVSLGPVFGARSENYPTSDMSLGAQNGSVSLAVAGAEGRVPEAQPKEKNTSVDSVGSIVAAPGKLGAILRDVRQAARLEVLEVGRG